MRVELSRDVRRVAEHGDDHSPLDSQLLDEPGGHEHAAENERGVDDRQRGRAESINLKYAKKRSIFGLLNFLYKSSRLYAKF